MANTIAKLAVIITGDASPLTKTMDRASLSIQKFGKSDMLGQKANQLKQVFGSLASGNVLGIVANVAKIAGPLGVAAAAAGALAFKLAAVSDAQRVAAGANPAETWAGQWDRVQTQVGRVAAILGRPLADIFLRETKQVADVLEMIVRSTMPEWVRQEEAAIAAAKKKNELVKQAAELKKQEAKAAEEAAAKAKDVAAFEHQRGMESLGRARAIADSVRTPREELVGALAELSQLFAQGFLTAQNYERAATAAGSKFAEATKMQRASAESFATPNVGAATRWTSAGFSAVQDARASGEKQAAIQKEQLAEQKRSNELLEELRKLGLSKESADIVVEEVFF